MKREERNKEGKKVFVCFPVRFEEVKRPYGTERTVPS